MIVDSNETTNNNHEPTNNSHETTTPTTTWDNYRSPPYRGLTV